MSNKKNLNPFEIAGSLDKYTEIFSGNSKQKPAADDAFKFLKVHDHAAGILYSGKNQSSNSEQERILHESFINTTHELVQYNHIKSNSSYKEWVKAYRFLWLKHIEIFVFCLMLLYISFLIGWNIGVYHDSFVPLIIHQEFMEMIIDNKAWFESLQESPVLGGFSIAVNNIRVSIYAFIGGAVLGIGGIYLLLFNGIFFGAIFGYCFTNGFHEELLNFVLAHGPLELTIIVASTFSGLIIGRVFYLTPYNNFSKNFRTACKESFTIASGVIPWLILAAAVEGFVSPFHFFSTESKAIAGFAFLLIFLIWTFKRTPENKLDYS